MRRITLKPRFTEDELRTTRNINETGHLFCLYCDTLKVLIQYFRYSEDGKKQPSVRGPRVSVIYPSDRGDSGDTKLLRLEVPLWYVSRFTVKGRWGSKDQ